MGLKLGPDVLAFNGINFIGIGDKSGWIWATIWDVGLMLDQVAAVCFLHWSVWPVGCSRFVLVAKVKWRSNCSVYIYIYIYLTNCDLILNYHSYHIPSLPIQGCDWEPHIFYCKRQLSVAQQGAESAAVPGLWPMTLTIPAGANQ